MTKLPATQEPPDHSIVMTRTVLKMPSPSAWARVRNPLRWPLYLRLLLGVATGIAVGATFGDREIALGWKNADLGEIAGLYIRLLTMMATPLIFFAVADAFVQTAISGRQGLKMLLICAVNVVVAFAIGLTILNLWQPGRVWRGLLPQLAAHSAATEGSQAQALSQTAAETSLTALDLIKSHIPSSIAQPFTENMTFAVAALAILVGVAVRSLRRAREAAEAEAADTLARLITASCQVLFKVLAWLIELAPFAVCLAMAGTVGKINNLGELLPCFGVFLAVVLAALGLHALVYYPLSAWLIGGKPPWLYLREGAGAILTGFSINSSLATAPLTLAALDRMQVSPSSARLSACAGTNFNNDGITLYEAITALFIAQAAGMELNLTQQISVLLIALAGSMGIAGIPNSGLIILTLVLKAARLPDEAIGWALPIVLGIDFINARVRSAVNVMGDMQVAILLDAGTKRDQRRTAADGSPTDPGESPASSRRRDGQWAT